MSVNQRKSIDNAIWLCANCSIDIDKDVERYPALTLKEWKKKSEDTARFELGRKLPSNNETIDTVSAALTGLPKSYISTAISNVHKASENSLEILDPRFFVKTAHEDGKTSIGIYAKENVQISMKIYGENARQHIEKFKMLFEHGKDLEIDSGAMAIEGSKLLEEIFCTTKGVFSISSRKIAATQKLWLVQKDTKLIEYFDDIQGFISLGTKSFTFEGAACNDLFKFNYQKSLGEKDDKANLTMSLCLDQWEGLSVSFLPYFEKLYSLFKRMSDGWELFTSLEVKGLTVLSSKGFVVEKWGYILNTVRFLYYVSCSKVVADRLKLDIRFTSSLSYIEEEYKCICEVSDMLKCNVVYDEASIENNVTCELIIDNKSTVVDLLKKPDQLANIKIVHNDREEITIFGKKIILPPKVITLESVLPKIHGKIESLKQGDIIKVEWLPQVNFKCEVGYEL